MALARWQDCTRHKIHATRTNCMRCWEWSNPPFANQASPDFKSNSPNLDPNAGTGEPTAMAASSTSAEAHLDANGVKCVSLAVDFAGDSRDGDLKAVVQALCGWEAGATITLTVISGGITNLLFKASSEGKDDVLVRVFGAKTEMMIDRQRDNRA